ncbi:uncharacterized protein KGF55_000216 [Candida pseudojiufengensis]|uniref:uncharacterized protein n=1 Tax=Candida pseudojiufengensis TaxID=497109 RepID=UPI002224FA70|nr:uncharacterized protein KGF55_000216 [Candida pseudojiufengensis]KAI5966807.1 hypothetical protein KGF55_000216 [Candida pseudojiufengensis]
MSSLVKKGSQFTPKVKKIVRRKPISTSDVPTPEPSQISQPNQISSRRSSVTQNKQFDTPPATQFKGSKKPRSSFDLTATRPVINLNEENVDPMDKTQNTESAIIDSDEGEVEDEVLKKNLSKPVSRRNSISQRRLSGINQPGQRSRSASISLRTHGDGGHVIHHSAKISIPTSSAKAKRRRSSVGGSRSKRPSITLASPPVIAVTAPALKPSANAPKIIPSQQQQPQQAQQPVIQTFTSKPGAAPISMIMNDNEPEKNNQEAISQVNKSLGVENAISQEFVVGIDPTTNKLKKFRRKGAPKKEIKDETGFSNISNISLDDYLPVEPDNLITTVTSISQLPSGIKDEDLDLYGELKFEYEGMTMADLCKPTIKVGEVSTNFALVQKAEKQLKEKRLQRKLDRDRARKERISLQEATLKNEGKTEQEIREEQERDKSRNRNGSDLLDLQDDEADNNSRSTAVQLTMVDGKMGYSEESAVVYKPRADTSGRSVEESNPYANPVTSTTYSKRTYTDKWTPEELKDFYQALSMFGTDFSLISQLYPHRTRKQIKAKFALEEKKYPEVIDLALRRKLPVDFEKYCGQTKNEIKTIEQYNEDLKKVRTEHESNMNAIAVARERAFKEDAEANRRREIEIRTGSKPMTTAERRKELRKNETVVGSIDDLKRE